MSRQARRISQGMHAPTAHHRRRRRHTSHSPLERTVVVPERVATRAVRSAVNTSTKSLGRISIAGVTMLAGAAACVVMMTVAGQLAAAAGEFAVAPPISLAAGVAALACGVHLPKRLVAIASRYARQGLAEFRGRDGRRINAADTETGDAAFRGIALAVCLLVTGVLIALIPTLVRAGYAIRGFLFEHFVWSWPALGMLDFAFALGVLFAPMFVLGVGLVILQGMARRAAAERGSLFYCAVGGVMVGMVALALADMNSIGAATVLAATPLPLLVVACALGLRYTNEF